MIPWFEISVVANLVTSLSIFTGFAVYKIEKSDEEIHDIQRAIISFRSNVTVLDAMVRTELFSEISARVVYSDSLNGLIPSLLVKFNEAVKLYAAMKPKEQETFSEKTGKDLGAIVGNIPISLETPYVIQVENKIENLLVLSMPFTTKASGLERLSQTVYRLFFQLLSKYRHICLDNDTWCMIFDNMISNESEIENEELFKNTICQYLVSLLSQIASDHDQKDIDTFVKIINLVCNSYLSKPIKSFKKLVKNNISLMPFEQIDTFVGQLSEAQKAFRVVLTRDEEIQYSSLAKEFEIHNK